MSSRSGRPRTVVAALTLALVTVVPVIGAQRAPSPGLGGPVVVERAPEASAAGPYEKDNRTATSTPPSGPGGRPDQPVGADPTDAEDGSPDVPAPTPTWARATSGSRPSSATDSDAHSDTGYTGAEPVAPESPLPADGGARGARSATPAPTVTPTPSSSDDDGDDGDDGGADDDGGDDG
ncbi:hypothetical protein [Streptomyces sp. NPDC002851]